jgi:hypothetical protein
MPAIISPQLEDMRMTIAAVSFVAVLVLSLFVRLTVDTSLDDAVLRDMMRAEKEFRSHRRYPI